MCSTWKPSSSIALMTFAGGGEPPVWMSHDVRELALLLVRRVDQHREHRRRAAHVRDAVLDDHREDRAGSTARRQTCVPPIAVTDQGKHQPLQWNIGSVHRYTGRGGIAHAMTLPTASRNVPRWW